MPAQCGAGLGGCVVAMLWYICVLVCVCVWSMMKWLELSQVVAAVPSSCTLPLLALAVPFFRQFIHKFRVSSQLIRHDYTHTHTHTGAGTSVA